MNQKPSLSDNHPITLQQKKKLIDVYEQTGNMALAMRESGIRSPRTAYLWWNRFVEAGEDALEPRSHARKNQKRLPGNIVKQICELRTQEPQWGRRRIADELTRYHGQQVVSPASVEAVLRHAGLWEQSAQHTATPQLVNTPSWLRGGFDYDSLLQIVKEGIHLSVNSQARAASQVLYQQVWEPLETNPTLQNSLLATPELGSWLLSSRLQLGHSLMNSGHWSGAAHQLRKAIDWMKEQEHDVKVQRRPWEDEPNIVSLRRDDVWLGCYHHLGLVLGKKDVKEGLAYLQTALAGLQRFHNKIVSGDPTAIGSLERDLANLKLRLRHFSEFEVRQHILHAQQNAEDSGNVGIQAYTHITWGRFYDRLARAAGEREKAIRYQYREDMQQSIEQALQLVEAEQEDHDRPMRQTMCFVNTALLAQTHKMTVDEQRLQRAAQNCLTYGYGHQAEKLLAMPDIHIWLPEDMLQKLSNLLAAENVEATLPSE